MPSFIAILLLDYVYCSQVGSVSVGGLNHRTLHARSENTKIR